MANKMIVMVSGLDDASHGEINVLDSSDQAAALIETLLESGFEQERIRVFGGDELQMQVHHRPVVSLVGPSARTEGRGGRKDEPNVETTPEDAPATQQEQETENATVRSRSAEQEEVASQPFVRNGVRFSTQFRAA